MPEQITLEEALKLVSFKHVTGLGWEILDVNSYVLGNVHGDVGGDVCGSVGGDVWGDVTGNVWGTINGRNWESIETPKDKIQHFIEESGNQELIDAFNQMEDN